MKDQKIHEIFTLNKINMMQETIPLRKLKKKS